VAGSRDTGEAAKDRAARAAEAAARASYGKLVAWLAAQTRDVAAAEDALAEAFASALETWPVKGMPRSPEAWLLAAARRRAIDASRRARTRSQAEREIVMRIEELEAEAGRDGVHGDERLGLIFACAHPAIDAGARAPLILQTILGFDAAAIASAFLVSPASMSQRLVRAKRKLRDAGIPFVVPEAAELPARLDAVLDAVYAVFTQGWADPAGVDPKSRGLTEEAIWLARLLTAILPEEPETAGLAALMLYAEARRGARRTPAGEFVPLSEQDTAAWDSALIDEAEALIHRAAAHRRPGRFQIEAAIQSAHANRRRTGVTDWLAIAGLYEALFALTGSVVVAINRAVAIGEASGPRAGLAALDEACDENRLAAYQPYWAARAELLARIGDVGAAHAAYDRAIGLESDPVLRRFLQDRQGALDRLP
jgi:RNA polymerase sigma-70 factor (ECF subfamily)